MRRGDLAKSLEIRVPDFQKEVIIPLIYELRNIKLIQSYGYSTSPVNKVAERKRNKVQGIIASIHSKQKPAPFDSNPIHKSLSLKLKQAARAHPPLPPKLQADLPPETGCLMEVDEQIGVKMVQAEQNFALFAEKIRKVLGRAQHQSQSRVLSQKKQEVEYFIRCISQSQPSRANPETIRPVKGMLEELSQLEKAGKDTPVKRRAQSAKTMRKNESAQLSSKLYKSRWLDQNSSDSCSDKRDGPREAQLKKSKHIISSINECLTEERVANREVWTKLKSMRGEWGQGGALGTSFLRSGNANITPSTLSLLKDRRLQLRARERIDQEYLKQ